jgi:hypothetical protein
VEPAAGQVTGQQPSPARPPLVLPQEYGRAIDDPNTALLEQIRARLIRRQFRPVVLLLVLGAIEYLSFSEGDLTEPVFLSIVILVLLASLATTCWLYLPLQRRGKALLSRFGWRPVPVTLLSDKPCQVRITLEGTEMTLRLRRFYWVAKQALLRTGTLWICGPDERGRALVRVAGSIGSGMADVIEATPRGTPPVLARPSTPRPGDDPALRWQRRVYHRVMLGQLALLLLIIGIGVGIVSRAEPGSLGYASPAVYGGAAALLVGLVLAALGYARGSKMLRQLADAPYWQPVPVSLDVWDEPANTSFRTGAGRVILPNGYHAYVDFPRLSFDLAANMRATGVLWLAGDGVPGETVPIGLPGYPLRGIAKFRM